MLMPINSPGLLWELARNYFGMREGTLMALASASNSRLLKSIESKVPEILGTESDTTIMYDYFSKLVSTVNHLTSKERGMLFTGFDKNFSLEDNRISMVMKEIQAVSEKIMQFNLDKIINQTGVCAKDCYLAMSGGYVLNCPTNSYLMNKYNFKGFLAPPCVNDSGISMGYAL